MRSKAQPRPTSAAASSASVGAGARAALQRHQVQVAGQRVPEVGPLLPRVDPGDQVGREEQCGAKCERPGYRDRPRQRSPAESQQPADSTGTRARPAKPRLTLLASQSAGSWPSRRRSWRGHGQPRSRGRQPGRPSRTRGRPTSSASSRFPESSRSMAASGSVRPVSARRTASQQPRPVRGPREPARHSRAPPHPVAAGWPESAPPRVQSQRPLLSLWRQARSRADRELTAGRLLVRSQEPAWRRHRAQLVQPAEAARVQGDDEAPSRPGRLPCRRALSRSG